MIDTVAAITRVDQALPERVFTGSSTTEIFDSVDGVNVRLFRNPTEDEGYGPRFTYWPGEDGGWLKAEYSVPKLLARQPGTEGRSLIDAITQDDVDASFRLVDAWVHSVLGMGDALPSVADWNCQRVDYTTMWHVGELLPVYMGVLQKLRLKNLSRHPYDASEGVVWKSRSTRGRWVKFYNKTKELMKSAPTLAGDKQGVLRFEVSNYKDAVKYMADAWFGVERTVHEMTRLPRALYVQARMFEQLGLAASDEYGSDELLLWRVRDTFGVRSAAAVYYALVVHEEYGTSAFRELDLIGRSSYYNNVKRLRDAGFLTDTDDVARQPLPALHLPVSVLHNAIEAANNLGLFEPPPTRQLARENWGKFSALFGVTGPDSEYLRERCCLLLDGQTAGVVGY